jgi:hypothetical protein
MGNLGMHTVTIFDPLPGGWKETNPRWIAALPAGAGGAGGGGGGGGGDPTSCRGL